jgi:hypothetical protein
MAASGGRIDSGEVCVCVFWGGRGTDEIVHCEDLIEDEVVHVVRMPFFTALRQRAFRQSIPSTKKIELGCKKAMDR